MKCVFKDSECIYGWREDRVSHDDCRRCRYVPDMQFGESTEMRILCAIAGKRELQKKYYGDVVKKDPKWLSRLLKENNGILGIEGCFDHRRTLEQTVISEPYDLYIEDFRRLIAFCDKNNLTFVVDGNSAHFPGRCFRILINKRNKL